MSLDMPIDKSKDNELENKSPIGQGKSLMDLRKEAALSVVKKDNPLIKSVQSNQSDSNSILPTKINHSDNLIKLLSNSFSNHRERINAEKKIRSYFDGLDK